MSEKMMGMLVGCHEIVLGSVDGPSKLRSFSRSMVEVRWELEGDGAGRGGLVQHLRTLEKPTHPNLSPSHMLT